MKYVIIASAFAGNKGAASMLEASIQTITKADKDASFTLFSIYPEQDRRQNTYKNVTIIATKPLALALIVNPLSLIYKILPPLRPILRNQKHIKALAESSALLDQGGVSFIDGRSKFLIFNVATILPGLLVGTRVIKCSQAMGPFKGRVNKFLSGSILPQVNAIFARGAVTEEHLKTLNLKNVTLCADYAFLLSVSEESEKKAKDILKSSGFKLDTNFKKVGILPSEVVRKKSESKGQDYSRFNVEFIDSLLLKGFEVVLIPHSARSGVDSRHNNDLPVCKEIAKSIKHKNFIFIDKELSAQELRYIIGSMDLIVTSRFHAMVSALSTITPALIVGWSHKYKEVMDMFRLKEAAYDSSELNSEMLAEAFEKVLNQEKSMADLIKKNLPAVQESAYKQVLTIVEKQKS